MNTPTIPASRSTTTVNLNTTTMMSGVSSYSYGASNANSNVQSLQGSILAISCGSGLTTWAYDNHNKDNDNDDTADNAPTAAAVTRYPHGDDEKDNKIISSFCWNHNRMVLATCCASSSSMGDSIVLMSSQTGSRLDSIHHDQNGNGSVACSLQFGGKSRYLCVGDDHGNVALWDLKKKMRVRHFQPPPSLQDGNKATATPSIQVALDPTDTYVLNLTIQALYVYNLREATLAATLLPPQDEEGHDGEISTGTFTKFGTSTDEPRWVAVGTNDGSVVLYDIERKTTNNGHSSLPDNGLSSLSRYPDLALLRRHHGVVTGVAWSPIHDHSIVTAGRDGTLQIHDVSTGESSKVALSDGSPSHIQSMSVQTIDGVSITCAVGCNSGDVLVYDLLNPEDDDNLVADLVASLLVDGPVQQVQFAPPPRMKDHIHGRSTVTAASNTPDKASTPSTTLPMALTPAQLRLQVAPEANEDTKNEASTILKSNENIQQKQEPSSNSPTHRMGPPFVGMIRKSPLSPRRTAIVQATRQQPPKKSSIPLLNTTVTDSRTSQSEVPKNSPASVNAQSIAIKPRATPRSTFMKTRSIAIRQQLYATSPRDENMNEEPLPQSQPQEMLDMVRITPCRTLRCKHESLSFVFLTLDPVDRERL